MITKKKRSKTKRCVWLCLACLRLVVVQASESGSNDVNHLHLSACDMCEKGDYATSISVWRDIWPQTVDACSELRYKVAYNIARAYVKWFENCDMDSSVITCENIVRCDTYLIRAKEVEKTDFQCRKKILDKIPSFRKAVMDFCRKKLAERGDVNMQYALGIMYGHCNNYVDAVEWVSKAAARNHAGAQSYLGMMYRGGWGVEKNYDIAVNLFRKAADQGDANGQGELGTCYSKGWGVEKDYVEAAKWYRKAADQGDAGSEWNLGLCYMNGQGVKVDMIEAVKWIRRAAEKGANENLVASAQYKLGYCYWEGKGVAKDKKTAMLWFRKAAARGHDKAKEFLASYDSFSINCNKPSDKEPLVYNPYEMTMPLGMFRGLGTAVMSPCNIFMSWPASFELESDLWLGPLPLVGTICASAYIVKDAIVGLADFCTVGWAGNLFYDEETSPWWWQRFGGDTKAEILR